MLTKCGFGYKVNVTDVFLCLKVLQDFRILYTHQCDRMFSKWSSLAPKIITYADAQNGGRWRRPSEVMKSGTVLL